MFSKEKLTQARKKQQSIGIKTFTQTHYTDLNNKKKGTAQIVY